MAHEASQTSHTWIVSDDRSEIVAVLHYGHRSEFQHANGLVVVAVPRLAKQHRPTGICLDCKRNDDEEGAKQNKASDYSGDVECSFNCSVERSKGGLEDPHRHHVAELSDPRHGHEIDSFNRDDVNVNWQL